MHMSQINGSSVSGEALVRAIGLILSNSTVYGPTHGVTKQATDACFQLLKELWKTADAVFNLADDELLVNNSTVEQKNALIKHFVEHLEARDISNFTLKRGMTREQFDGFVEVLTAQPVELQQLGEFSGAIAAVGLNEVVSTRKVVYREIAEDEVVVDKEKLDKLGTAEDAGGSSEEAAKSVVAFLRGDVVADDDHAAASVREMGGDIDQLSELIMHSAHVEESKVNLDEGETLGELVVGCLNRVYKALTDDPSFNTQKTKKQIHKTLVLLERELLDRLHSAEGDVADEDVEKVHDAIEGMEDELTIDSLTQEYVKKRSAVSGSEKRLLRYIKKKGAGNIEESDLKSRLVDSGLDIDDWHELLVKSGVVDSAKERSGSGVGLGVGEGNGAGAGIGALGDLARLLEKVEEDAGKTGGKPGATPEDDGVDSVEDTVSGGHSTVMLRVPEEVFKDDLQAIQTEVNRIILRTEKRIEKLVEEVEGPGKEKGDNDSAPPKLSRKRLFEILAEIGQELCQPLAVINCSVDMLRSGSLGEVTKVQTEMLDMAVSSGDKMRMLIDKLIAIAGVPDDLVVNKQIQSSLYE